MSNNPMDNTNHSPIIIDPRMLNNYYKHDDEISLVDLWLSLVKRKKIFFTVFLIIFGIGFLFALLKPTIYSYITTIVIGTKSDRETPIQAIETVKSEVVSAYINQALHDYYNANDIDIDIIEIKVENPKDTSLLVLKSSGNIDASDMHIAIHSNILHRLTEKHKATSEAIKEGLNDKILTLNNKIEDLEDEQLFASTQLEAKNELEEKRKELVKLQEYKVNLDNDLTRLKSLQTLLLKQYKADINNLQTAIENQQVAAQGKLDTPLLVLLTSELQQSRTHISALDERLNIKIPAQKEKIKQQIADNSRQQENQQVVIQQAEYSLAKLQLNRNRQIATLKTQIAKINNDLNSLPVTHAIVPPSRSFEPSPSKKMLIVAVAAVLATFLGLFSALFAGFLTKVKEQE